MDQTPNSKPPDVTDQAIAGTGEPIKRPRRLHLRWLVLAHVAIGLSTGILVAWTRSPSKPNLVATVFVGIVFCQASLVGIWGGLGMSSRWNRLLGVMLGMGYLGLLMDLCLVGYLTSDSHFIVSLATLPVAGVLLIVRCFGVRICLTTVTKVAAHRNQFSIRQLLILTFAVACLMSLVKWLEPHLLPVTNPFLLALNGLFRATVGLLLVWPVLGTRRPILPSTIAVAIAAGLGLCLLTWFPPFAWTVVPWWMTVISVEALSLVASLLVVRSCGYRLVRLPSSRTVTKDAVA